MSETQTSDATEPTLATVDQAMLDVGDDIAGIDAAYQARADAAAEFVPWYLGEWNDLEMRDKLADVELAMHIAFHKAQAESQHSQVRAERSRLQWNYGQDFEAQVNRDLQAQKGTKRSVAYSTGTAGYRKVTTQPSAVIDDPVKAEAHARLYCPDALKVTIKPSVVLKAIQTTGEEFPGTHIEPGESKDTFYPKRPDMPDMPQMEADDDGTTISE